MIYLEKTDIHSTLTTYVYCAFAQLYAAEQAGKRAYINWPAHRNKWLASYWDDAKFAEMPNAYDWYFMQPHVEDTDPEPVTETWTWELGYPDAPVHLYAQPLNVIRNFYRSHLKFSDEVEARGQALIDKYGIDFENTIGVTWRGTDIYLDGRPRIPIEAYFPWIDRALEDKPNAKIICTAEEDGILDPLLARYPQAVKIHEFYQAPHGGKDNPERFSPISGFERGLQPALMVWLFSKCAWYIKNRSSVAAVASWISDGKIASLAHPENLGYVNNSEWANVVEFQGVKYPI